MLQLVFDSWTTAKEGCIAQGSKCFGVSDSKCDNQGIITLCDARNITTADDLGTDMMSCVFERPHIDDPAQTTTMATTPAPTSNATHLCNTPTANLIEVCSSSADSCEAAFTPKRRSHLGLGLATIETTCSQLCQEASLVCEGGWGSFDGTCANKTENAAVLGNEGSNSCPVGTHSVPDSDCSAANEAFLPPSKSVILPVKVGVWNHLPLGCSTLSGGDYTAYYNLKRHGINNGSYTPICTKGNGCNMVYNSQICRWGPFWWMLPTITYHTIP